MEKSANGDYVCSDFPDFHPNLSPKEMFQLGCFGGTYFRDIVIDGKWHRQAWKEFEHLGWFQGLDIQTQVSSDDYIISRNRYKVKCGQSLEVWLDKGWIKTDYDSHGWVHWYCRFFQGRRCDDDQRQISRWKAIAGEKGRWKRNLIAKCVKAGKSYDDESVSPVVRQLLLHWAYQLSEEHFDQYKALLEKGKKTSFIPQYQMKHVVKDHDNEDEEEEATKNQQKRAQAEKEARDQRRLKRARLKNT